MDLFNGILSKLALLVIVFAVLAAIDVPNNPARYMLKSFCRTIGDFSGNLPIHARWCLRAMDGVPASPVSASPVVSVTAKQAKQCLSG